MRSRPRRHWGDAGLGMIEVLVGLALAAAIATVSAPALADWSERRALWEEGTRLALQVQAARTAAAMDGRSRALLFGDDTSPGWSVVMDGDGDGIRSSDIRDGTDPTVGSFSPLQAGSRQAAWGLAPGVPPVPGGTSPSSSLPFAPAGILSLSADGSASTGTAYLCARRHCAALRIYGPGGRVSLWEWHATRWRQRW